MNSVDKPRNNIITPESEYFTVNLIPIGLHKTFNVTSKEFSNTWVTLFHAGVTAYNQG